MQFEGGVVSKSGDRIRRGKKVLSKTETLID